MVTKPAPYNYQKYNEVDADGVQTMFTVIRDGKEHPETRAERLKRWQERGSYDPDCGYCESIPAHPTLSPFQPSHKASGRCRSGGRNHCSCDACF